jgi:hypothetical protein
VPQHPVFLGKNKLVCFDHIQAEACFPQFKQLNYMTASPENKIDKQHSISDKRHFLLLKATNLFLLPCF